MKKEKTSDIKKIFERVLKDQIFRKEVVRKSFEFFFPIYLHEYMEFEFAPFHKEIFHILEKKKYKFVVFAAFRGSAKSTIVTTAYTLWSVLGVQQNKFIVICSQTELKARQHLTSIKNQLVSNELLKKDLGPFEEEKNDLGNATAIIIKKMNVKIMICSIGQSIRGIRHNQHRPDLIILDDIEDQDSVRTKEGRTKTFDWLTGDIIPAGTGKTRVIAIGTLLHENSVLKRLQKKIENGEMKRNNGIYREYPILDNKGNSLWPGKYPTSESIEELREKMIDEVAWQREFMMKIIATDDQIVRPEWIQFWNKLPEKDLRGIYIGIDLATSQKDSADYVAIVVGYIYGIGKNMKIYIQKNPLNKRMPFPEQVEYIKALVAIEKLKHCRVKLFIENNGYQEALVQLLDSKKYDVEGVPSGHSKEFRLRLATSPMKDGQVLFAPEGCEELIDQLLGFGKENHDDLADAFSILILKVIENNPRVSGILFG